MKKTVVALTAVLAVALQPSVYARPVLTTPNEPSIREVTLSQIYRYAREMYRYGNYPQAIKAFQQMLSVECSNPVAQYHLQKMAQDDKFADLRDYLDHLPCKVLNFEEEDFLPASMYYETDPALMQEQLVYYNKRYRIAKASIRDAAENYARLTKELEEEIINLRNQVPATTQEADKISQTFTTNAESAARLDDEISRLKSQLANERQQAQKEIEHLRKQLGQQPAAMSTPTVQGVDKQTEVIFSAKDESIAELKERLANEVAGKPTTASQIAVPQTVPTPNKTQNATDMTGANADEEQIAKTRAELLQKQKELDAKDLELMTLQQKFDEIQQRLRAIQSVVTQQNAQIQSMQNDVRNLKQ